MAVRSWLRFQRGAVVAVLGEEGEAVSDTYSPCGYCGTPIDDNEVEEKTDERHSTGQCREFVYRAMNAHAARVRELEERLASTQEDVDSLNECLRLASERHAETLAKIDMHANAIKAAALLDMDMRRLPGSHVIDAHALAIRELAKGAP